ncbi:MAG: bifunctional 2-polyprenyl-6-hydroxyphenol methylase/3-demethylubiquinol 3-O-methyltransferase UbiG [Sphingomonadaceae bacterium]
MAKASITPTINPDEAAHFGAMAADWWDPKGSSAMLHKLNPVRLAFVRRAINRHWGLDERSLKPLIGKSALDVGCGAGLLSEPLARMGAAVTAIDAASENIAVAAAHAEAQALGIDYRCDDIAGLGGAFDLVISLEVIEHVAEPAAFFAALAARMSDGGLLIISTPNRTALSRIGLISIGETIGGIPKGTHDWDKFLTPDDIQPFITAAHLAIADQSGIGFNPATGFRLSDDLRLNYMMALVRA